MGNRHHTGQFVTGLLIQKGQQREQFLSLPLTCGGGVQRLPERPERLQCRTKELMEGASPGRALSPFGSAKGTPECLDLVVIPPDRKMVTFRKLFHFFKGLHQQVDIVWVDNVVR